MSRTSGTYTAPAGTWNPAVAGTPVDETDWNILLTDIETAIDESVYTTGLGATDNRLVRTDGTDTKKLQGSAIGVDDSANMTGVASIAVADGSAAAPSITHTGDTNTGFWFSAADTINASTSGVERFEVSASGTFGFNVAAQAASASILRIDEPSGNTANDTRVTISNVAGNRAALTQTNATDHITMAMGSASVGVLGNRWGLGMSGSGAYAIMVEHGGYPSTYHANVGIKVNATTALNPFTVGESEATTTSGQMVGIYKAGATYATLRNTTGNVETVIGSGTGAGIVGTASAHELQFYVANLPLLRFSGSVLRPENDGTVSLGDGTYRYSGLHLGATTAINWANGDVTLTHSTDNLAVGGGNLLVGYTTSNGSFLLQVNSQIFATNATISTSDGRFKTNVAPIEGATEIVKALRPVAYDWKPHDVHQFAKERQAGFIAQEVREAVAGTDWGASLIQENEQAGEPFLGLAETKLLPVVVKALQEALTRIETLEARLAEVAR